MHTKHCVYKKTYKKSCVYCWVKKHGIMFGNFTFFCKYLNNVKCSMLNKLFLFLGTVDLEGISRNTAYCSRCKVYGRINGRGTHYIIVGCDAGGQTLT